MAPWTIRSRPLCSLTRAATRPRTASAEMRTLTATSTSTKAATTPAPIFSSSFIRIRLNPPEERIL